MYLLGWEYGNKLNFLATKTLRNIDLASNLLSLDYYDDIVYVVYLKNE